MVKTRRETDSLGEIEVSADRYWGAQTERSLRNFRISSEKMPLEQVKAIALVKKGSAFVNCEMGLLPKNIAEWIMKAADEVIEGRLDDHFPLSVWQTGSGTQTNMNVNEVIANRAISFAHGVLGSKTPVHPNDHVNMSQSSNDVFPAAMHIAVCFLVRDQLMPVLHAVEGELEAKVEAFSHIVKVGRTHLMDAAPLTLGQEFSGYLAQISLAKKAVLDAMKGLFPLALGGTAVGTGLNSPKGFGERAAAKMGEWSHLPFTSASNKFAALAGHEPLLLMSGALRALAGALFKMGNDIRYLASGPRAGLAELILPANEPGSSIMPGKVNPTQAEALTMAMVQVMGHDAAIMMGSCQGAFELNVYKPLIIHNMVSMIHLLADASKSFLDRCLVGLLPNEKRIAYYLDHSLQLAAVLNTHIGYDKAAEIVKKAYAEDLSLKEAAKALSYLTEEEFDRIVDVKKMV